MDPQSTLTLIPLALGAAWASGINLYAAVAMLGIMGATGTTVLPQELEVLAHPAVIIAAIFMYFVEFFADKIPGVDSGWDAIHTFIRVPAGAVLAAGAVYHTEEPILIAAALITGTAVAGTAHATKSGTRLLINTSPEPFSNWTASVAEDISVVGMIWLAVAHPWWALGVFVVIVLLTAWLLPKVWRGVKFLFAKIASLFGGEKPVMEPRTAQAGAGGNPNDPEGLDAAYKGIEIAKPQE